MKTIQEVEQWRAEVEEFSGDASGLCGQAFVRYVEPDTVPKRVDGYFDLFAYWDFDRLVLWLGPELIVPLEVVQGDPVFQEAVLDKFGMECIAPGFWTLVPSLNLPGVIHAFVLLYNVPLTPPWVRRIVLVGEAV